MWCGCIFVWGCAFASKGCNIIWTIMINILYVSWAYIIVVIWRVQWKVQVEKKKMVRIIEYIKKKKYAQGRKTGRWWRLPGELGPKTRRRQRKVKGDNQAKERKGDSGLVQWPCRRSASFRSLPHSLSGSSHLWGGLGRSPNKWEVVLGFRQWPSLPCKRQWRHTLLTSLRMQICMPFMANTSL